MGRLIVTDTKIAQIPYRMKETGHPLYSYEELCYYMKSRMPLWLLENERKGLTEWIRERGVEIPETDFLNPKEAAALILEAGNYFREDETKDLLEEMEEYDDRITAVKEKEKGDLYLTYGKFLKAFFAYEKAIGAVTGEETDDFLGSLYHNKGVILSRLFYWEEAKACFQKAIEIGGFDESETAFELVKDMSRQEWKQGEETLISGAIEKKKKEFLAEIS